MAWFLNSYQCDDCGTSWEDEWSCCCDDECPNCGSGDWSPYESQDLTVVVYRSHVGFVVERSPDDADDRPNYAFVGRFADEPVAAAFAKKLPPPEF